MCIKGECNKLAAKYGYCRDHLKEADPVLYKRMISKEHDNYIKKKVQVWKWITPDGKVKCQWCGESRYEFMAIVNTKYIGKSHRKIHSKGNGNYIYGHISRLYIKKGIHQTPFKLLCHTCNKVYTIFRKHNIKNIEEYKTYLQSRKLTAAYSKRLKVLKHYSKDIKCECCGQSFYGVLEIDHINGGGNIERDKIGGGENMVNRIIKNNFPEGYRILCANCNQSLGLYGYCPHTKH